MKRRMGSRRRHPHLPFALFLLVFQPRPQPKTLATSPPVSSIIVIQYNNKPIVKSDDKTEAPCWRQNQQISALPLEKGASTGLPAEIRALRPSGMQVAG
jgi:hypothetical protein